MKSKVFDIMPVDTILTIVMTDDIVKSRQEIGEKWGLPVFVSEPGIAGLHTACYEECPGRTWIFLEHDPSLDRVTHELLHCVEYIDSWYNINSNEYRCYLLGYLTDRVWSWVQQQRVTK